MLRKLTLTMFQVRYRNSPLAGLHYKLMITYLKGNKILIILSSV
jgi:hypothetical protein